MDWKSSHPSTVTRRFSSIQLNWKRSPRTICWVFVDTKDRKLTCKLPDAWQTRDAAFAGSFKLRLSDLSSQCHMHFPLYVPLYSQFDIFPIVWSLSTLQNFCSSEYHLASDQRGRDWISYQSNPFDSSRYHCRTGMGSGVRTNFESTSLPLFLPYVLSTFDFLSFQRIGSKIHPSPDELLGFRVDTSCLYLDAQASNPDVI